MIAVIGVLTFIFAFIFGFAVGSNECRKADKSTYSYGCEHLWTRWTVDTEAGGQVRTCKKCGLTVLLKGEKNEL